MEESEDEAAADDDPSSVIKERLDEDDEDEGDVFLTSRDYRLQLRVRVQYGCPPTLGLKKYSYLLNLLNTLQVLTSRFCCCCCVLLVSTPGCCCCC